MNKGYYVLGLFLIGLLIPGVLSAQILNEGFENWTGGEPDDWLTTNVAGINTVTQSNDAHSGSSALKIEIIDFNGTAVTGNARSGSLTWPYFDISQDYAELTGYYQLHRADAGGTEIGIIAVTFFDAAFGQIVAVGLDTIGVADTYTQFNIAMDYTSGNGNPAAVATIDLVLGNTGGMPQIGSYFLVDDLSFGSVNSVEPLHSDILPDQFSLSQNYPNPFNPSTFIEFTIAQAAPVSLDIFNQRGQRVAEVVNEHLTAGSYKTDWHAGNLPSGIYYYRLTAGALTETRKLILMR